MKLANTTAAKLGRHLDPRIGMLTSGKFYAFAHGYDKPETVGTLEEVEAALGFRKPAKQTKKIWNVKLTFQYPAWDEVDGIDFPFIHAASKSEANRKARRQAEKDGHIPCKGKGFSTFTAVEQ